MFNVDRMQKAIYQTHFPLGSQNEVWEQDFGSVTVENESGAMQEQTTLSLSDIIRMNLSKSNIRLAFLSCSQSKFKVHIMNHKIGPCVHWFVEICLHKHTVIWLGPFVQSS